MALLALSGCSGGGGSQAKSGPPGAASAKATSGKASWEDPTSLLAGSITKVLFKTGRHTDDMAWPVPKAPAGTIWVASECQGKGKLRVDAGKYGTSTLKCQSDASGVTAETTFDHATSSGVVEATGDPGVTWALAIGWARHAS